MWSSSWWNLEQTWKQEMQLAKLQEVLHFMRTFTRLCNTSIQNILLEENGKNNRISTLLNFGGVTIGRIKYIRYLLKTITYFMIMQLTANLFHLMTLTRIIIFNMSVFFKLYRFFH